MEVEPDCALGWYDENVSAFEALDDHIGQMCKNKKVVLMIDEVDRTSNNRIFLHFLSLLRKKYLAAENGADYSFHSVILAGVYDVKNIKLKLINEGLYAPAETENKMYNSPWNIAVNFNIDMSFDPAEIATMLTEYEADHGTDMNIGEISAEIHSYTSGYPFLVSKICQCIDEESEKDWTPDGIKKAVKKITLEKNTLFDDVFKNFENNRELYDLIYDVLIIGSKRTYAVGDPTADLAMIYGIIKNEDEKITVSNKIFEIVICNYFVAKDEHKKNVRITGVLQQDIVRDGRFDMELCLKKFAEHYADIYTPKNEKFVEREGKFLFITYLKPLLNGHGFYHFESQLSDERRMDIVVDAGREQFVIELKIWRGEKNRDEGYKQLAGYLNTKKATEGYLLTFDFRKGANRERKAEWVDFEGKKIFDVII